MTHQLNTEEDLASAVDNVCCEEEKEPNNCIHLWQFSGRQGHRDIYYCIKCKETKQIMVY